MCLYIHTYIPTYLSRYLGTHSHKSLRKLGINDADAYVEWIFEAENTGTGIGTWACVWV